MYQIKNDTGDGDKGNGGNGGGDSFDDVWTSVVPIVYRW